jgi:hypothetical protein
MAPITTFAVTVAAGLVVAIAGWLARTMHNDVREFLTAVQKADERSRDNAEVLQEHDLIEQAPVNHIAREEEPHD